MLLPFSVTAGQTPGVADTIARLVTDISSRRDRNDFAAEALTTSHRSSPTGRTADEIETARRAPEPTTMKVSPLTPPVTAKEQEDRRDDADGGDSDSGRGLKRRRLHSHADIIIGGGHHYRHYRKHLQQPQYPRHGGDDVDDNKSSSSADFYGDNGNSRSSSISSSSSGGGSSCASGSGGVGARDRDGGGGGGGGGGPTAMTPLAGHPNQLLQPHPAEGVTSSSQPPRHNIKDNYQQITVVNNNNCNNEGDCLSPEIRNAVQQLATNNDKITLSLSTHLEENNDREETNQIIHEPIISFNVAENPIKSATINDKPQSVVDTDFDDPTITANGCLNSETSNDDCLSQSPLNLTRSQGSSEECGNKSEDDEGEYDDENEEKNGLGNAINDDENIVNGHNLPTEAPFPWNITLGNYNKQKQQHQDDKITAPPPQLLLTSGQLTTGCLQAAQLLIPTPRGIMTQTILAIPINDMVSSAITTPTASQQQLQQQLLYHSSNNVRQKNIRQQLNQTCQPSLSLPLNRYFQQQQTTADDTTTSGTPADNANNDNNNYDASMINNGTIAIDQYNNTQRRKWQSHDLTNKKHNFLSPQQKSLLRTKNGECGESMNVQRSNESPMIQTPAGTNVDARVYSSNNAASIITPMSPPTHGRNGNANGGGIDGIQRQTVWPTAVTTIDQHNGGDENDNEEDTKQLLQNQPTHVISPTPPTSSVNINGLKSLAPPSSQLNCHVKQSKDDDSASAAAAAAAAYNQQNAICTALATHMLCASQLAAAQQPMFDNMDNGSAVKKPNHVYNNNNNNVKTNNMMGVVNPAVLEKWMMEERYYYNNNNNNGKNIGGGHNHHQRYNAAAAAAAAAVELLSGGVSASSSGGGDSLASCKKRKRRTSFTPHALELLNGHFERNTHPSGSEITGLAHRLGYEREVIRIWFCNKRQALKNTVRTINGSGPTHMTSAKSHNNTSGY